MKSRKKVYLPKWQRFFVVPLMLLIWLFITYMEFFNPGNNEKMGLLGYLIMTTIFLGVGVVMWLMTSGKLPSYIIEEEEEKKDKS